MGAVIAERHTHIHTHTRTHLWLCVTFVGASNLAPTTTDTINAERKGQKASAKCGSIAGSARLGLARSCWPFEENSQRSTWLTQTQTQTYTDTHREIDRRQTEDFDCMIDSEDTLQLTESANNNDLSLTQN